MKSELLAMFEADQGERQSYPSVGTPEYRELRTRDAERRQRVAELMAAGAITPAEDYMSFKKLSGLCGGSPLGR